MQELENSLEINWQKFLAGDKPSIDVSGIIDWPEKQILSALSDGASLNIDYLNSVVEDFGREVTRVLSLKSERNLLVIAAIEQILIGLLAQIHNRMVNNLSETTNSLSKHLEPAIKLALLDSPSALALDGARHHVVKLLTVRRLAVNNKRNAELTKEIEKAIKNILTDRRLLNRLNARIYLLFVAAIFEPAKNGGRFGFLLNPRLDDNAQKLARKFFNAYKDLLILEKRIEGNISAFEGIRIVKERKNQDSTA